MVMLPGFRVSGTIFYKGSRSVLYRAHEESPGRSVVVKTTAAPYPLPAEVAALEHEFEIGRSLDLPGVVRHLELVPHEKSYCLILEDFGARSLADWISALGAFSVPRFLELAQKLTEALGTLHDRCIIHKDICPGNVLYHPESGTLKICDLGTAALFQRETQELTAHGVIEGTLAYIAPEQTGRMNRAIGPRADLYALGATFYCMLTGAPPFAAADVVEIVHCHIARSPAPPSARRPEIPEQVSAIVLKLLAKNAEDRYQTTHGLLSDLAECARRLDASGSIEPFPLGRDDLAPVLHISQKLYGREEQVATLLSTFEQAAAGACEIVFVGGYSGVGKSVLVREVHKPIAARRGYFVAGKCEQVGTHAPLSAFAQAVADVTRQVLTESEERLAYFRGRLRDAIDINGQLLIDLVPEVTDLLGVQPKVVELPPIEARDRFEGVLIDFLLAFAGPEHPLALFLDDVQWMDPASLRLFAQLATCPAARHILLIAAYRDNEVSPSDPLMVAGADLEKAGVPVRRLTLGPLDLDDVIALISDTLHCDAAAAQPLAELVVEKTGGNPFFLTQLLYTLYEEGGLKVDQKTRSWAWDVEQIRRMALSDNVVDLMIAKMKKYPEALGALLRLASCVGNTFDLGTLSIASGTTAREATLSLWDAVKDGLLLPLDSAYQYYLWSKQDREEAPPADAIRYRFAHDRIQEAAYAQIPKETLPDVRLRLGRLLLANLSPEQRAERLFDLVSHLNEARARLTSPEEILELAGMNLSAGRRAKAATDYHAAVQYLSHGMELLGQGGWDAHYDLSFGLHRELTECQHLSGNSARAEELFAVTKARARTRAHIGDVYQLMIRICQTAGDMAKGLGLGHQCLELFDVELPTDPALAQAAMGGMMGEIATRIGERQIKDLVDAELMTDPDIAVCLTVLHETWSCAVMSGNLLQVALTSLQMIVLSLRHGHSEYSSCGYVAYGAVLSNMGDYPKAYAFGKLAVALSQKFKNPLVIPKVNNTFANFINHFGSHVKTNVDLYTEAYQYARQSGDRWWGSWAVSWIRTTRLIKGDVLQDAYDTGELYRPYVRASGYTTLLHELDMEQQLMLCFMGKTEGRTSLSLGTVREEEVIDALKREGFEWGVHWYAVQKSLLHYLFEEQKEALEHSARAHEKRDVIPYSMTYSDHFFYRTLVLARSAAGPEREAALEEMRAHRDKMRTWAEHCPDNHRHKELLMSAEIARVEAANAEAAALYDKAIDAAKKGGFLHHEALANELAGKHLIAEGRPKAAKGYLTEAHYLYARWGAAPKAAHLAQSFPELVDRGPSRGSDSIDLEHTVSTRFGPDQIDMATVMKAAQALSGEIVLSRLLDQIVRIGLENAGARWGVLLLDRDGQLTVEATAAEGGESRTLQAVPLEQSEDVPRSVIQYVKRTGKIVSLDDAAADPRFQADPYLAARATRSILCLPAIRQTKLRGILYLENGLVRGAFPRERTRLLSVLAVQAAISLENALLYDTLEQRVEARTRELKEKNHELARTLRELRDAQDRMIVQNRLAALGSLTAGIAHELRNPLNFVNSFSELTVELADELLGEISQDKDRLAPERVSAFDELGASIKTNLTKVVEHGNRAARIISAMLLHARGETGEREETDLNALVREYVNLAYQAMRSREPPIDAAIRMDLDPSLGLVNVAPQEMVRVLLNLMDNASYAAALKKASTPGCSPEIIVMTRELGDRVEIRVRDNGIGVPAAIRGRLFEPFFTTKPAGQGTGLGLSISREIVEQGNGGELRFETEEGEFTEFIVALPRR